MFKLSFDILRLIFPLLAQRDLVECMTVCQSWYNIIRDHVSFRVIFIHNQKQLNRLISRAKEDPLLGRKVERIRVELGFNVEYRFDSTILVNLFPNLRDFFVQSFHAWDFTKPPVKPRQNHPWCESIEKVVERQSDIGIETVLQSGLCKNLTSISIKGDRDPAGDFIELLANAPSLKTLHLSRYTVSFDDLELLHEMIPLLCSLSLNDISCSPNHLPLVIKPATSIKYFRYTDADFDSSDGYNPHLTYICKKYTQLEDLILHIDPFDPPDSRSQNNTNFLEEEKKMLISYFKTLRPYLKTFSLFKYDSDLKHPTSFGFNLLDQAGCQIENLRLDNQSDTIWLDQLAQTTQTQSIQSLAISLIFKGGIKPTSFGWFTRFAMLKDLTLRFPDVPGTLKKLSVIRLTDLLNYLNGNQLVTLELRHVELKVDEANRTNVYPLLKNLLLSHVRFGKGTDTFISRAFPNLKSLKLNQCFKKRESFILPHTNLSNLEILNTSENDDFPILLITLRDGQQRLYNSRATYTRSPYSRNDWKTDIFTIPYISSKLSDESDDIPSLTIVCKSVYDFTMNIGTIS